MSAAAYDVPSREERVLGAPPRVRVALGGLGAWLVPFAAILYLALQGGGYGSVVRGQVGIALWWGVLIGAVVAAVPRYVTRRGWCAIGLLAAFLAWSALSVTWSESDERTFAEIGRLATILGALVLSLAVLRDRFARQMLFGIATGLGVVALLAVLSRLHPGWFPEPLPGTSLSRLSYPLNYWNGLAVLVAMGIPLVLATATMARSIVARGAAAAALPVMVSCVLLTISRGGFAAAAAALVAFLVLTDDRLPKLATIAVVAPGSTILVAAALDRAELRDGLRTALAREQGDEILLALVLVMVGTAVAHAGVSLLVRHATRPRWLMPSRRAVTVGGLVAVTLGGAAATAAGVPGAVSDAWQEFKAPRLAAADVGSASTFQRLGSTTGNGRYQYWESAVRAQETRPLGGRGAGTFEYWWGRDGTRFGGYVRDAHSLYMQTFAETGLVGLALLVAFLMLLLAVGIWRAIRGPAEDRPIVAAATAGLIAFMLGAAVEWVWQITVIPVTLMMLAAVLLVGRQLPRVSIQSRAVLVVASLCCLPVLTISVAGASRVVDSQAAAGRGELMAALQAARDAQALQPYAATPWLQEALVLERAGDLDGAAVAAAEATDREATNWRTWLIRSRIEAQRGRAAVAVEHWRRARSLNPHSPIFTGRARA